MDLNTGKIKLLKKPVDVEAWHPTGVKWCRENQRLYLANYLGKDILIFELSEQDDLILVKRYIDPELVSPENIDVIDQGKTFVVADYDNNKVILFNESGKIWSRDVGNAHGVAFSNDHKFIYASGLTPAKLYKFDLQGKLINKIGESGWSKNGYQWPTSVSILDKNICISDAHTGKISFVDEELNFQRSIGGNGLGIDLFNMPYSAIWENKDFLLVSDTFKRRILRINPSKNEIISIYQGDNFVGINEDNKWLSESQKPFGLEYKERINLSQTVNIDFNEFGFRPLWNPSYGNFRYSKQGLFKQKSFRLIFTQGTGLFLTSEYYWILAKNFKYENRDFTIIGSPQAKRWLLLYKGIVCPIDIGLDFWIKNDSIVSSRGIVILLETLASKGQQRIESYIQSLKNGIMPLRAIEDFFKISDLSSKLPSFFVSKKGKKFAENLVNAKTFTDQQKIAKQFLNSIEEDTKLYFSEIAIASMVVYGFVEE